MKVKLRLLALCVLLCCLTLVAAGQKYVDRNRVRATERQAAINKPRFAMGLATDTHL